MKKRTSDKDLETFFVYLREHFEKEDIQEHSRLGQALLNLTTAISNINGDFFYNENEVFLKKLEEVVYNG